MRKLASLLLAVALAAPFGDAGALSSGGVGTCQAAAGADARALQGGHGLLGEEPTGHRLFLPAGAVTAERTEGTGGRGPSPRGAGDAPSGAPVRAVPRPPTVCAASSPGSASVPTGTFFLAFPAHPSTAPPHRV